MKNTPVRFTSTALLSLALLLAPSMALKAEGAAQSPSEQSGSAVESASPDGLIKAIASELIKRIKTDREALSADPATLYSMVDQVVLPHFDFPLMGRLVLGKQWTSASEEQQARFLNSFKTLLVKTYSNALLQYSNEKIEFSPAELGSKPGRASVVSTITSAGAAPVTMQYRMRQLDDHWLVYDVVVDNISLVTNYRGTYAAEIQRGGLDSLIAKLEEQTAG